MDKEKYCFAEIDEAKITELNHLQERFREDGREIILIAYEKKCC